VPTFDKQPYKQATLIHVVHDCLALVLGVHGLIRRGSGRAARALRRGAVGDGHIGTSRKSALRKLAKTASAAARP